MSEFRPRIDAPRRSGGDGIPDVFVSNEQDVHDVDIARWRTLALAALMDQGVRGGCELSLFFVDEATMSDLNSEHMGKIGPTDVLAFPLDGVEIMEAQGPGALSRGPARPHPDHDDMPTLLGDVFVCPTIAAKQASTHAGCFDDEIALLVVHGILHVLGFDHNNDEATLEMRTKEMSVLVKHHWGSVAPENFKQEQEE